MDVEKDERVPISGETNDKNEPSLLTINEGNFDKSVRETTLNEMEICSGADSNSGQVNGHLESTVNYGHGDVDMDATLQTNTKIPESASEEGLASIKTKKRRRSSGFNVSLKDSPDGTSRYGRARKPKLDCEDFLPTEALFGKSPKKGRKSVDASSTPIPGVAFQTGNTSSALNGSFNESLSSENEPGDIGDLSDDLKLLREGEENKESADDEVSTEYEPGDLIWGRLGRHPFWPCIVINEPENTSSDNTGYFKKTGRSRLLYHVLFYGDNGKRSWVSSSMIFRFLGLADFDLQVARITKEMRKNNPKSFEGFFVKPSTKPKWEAAVLEAEEVMPMTRDERLDAMIAAVCQMRGMKSNTTGDVTDGEDFATDGTLEEINEDASGDGPTSEKKKKRFISRTDLSPTERKKRGRPRKVDVSLNQSEYLSPKPTAKNTIGRPRKRKLLSLEDSSQTTICESDEDVDWKSVKKQKRRKKKGKEGKSKVIDSKAFNMFTETHLERVLDEHSEMTEDDARGYLRLLWERKTEDEKSEYVCLVGSDDKSDNESAEEEEDGLNDSGVEEEVATVASSDPSKEENDEEQPVIISKKKINLFRGYRMERVCQGCEKPGNTVKCRGPCAGVFHVECARGADNSSGSFRIVGDCDEKPKKRGRKKKVDCLAEVQVVPKSKVVSRPKKIYAEEGTDSDLDYADGEGAHEALDENAVLKMILGDDATMPEVTVLDHKESSDEEDDAEDSMEVTGGPLSINTSSITDFRCGDCAVMRTPLCFVCGQATDPTGEDSVRIRCSVAYCGKHYHTECLKVLWPQAYYSSHKGVVQSLACPQHVCHTCVSDNPRDSKGRFSHERLVRCIRCPTSYHFGNYCVPAGSEILTATQMICPRHYEPPKKAVHINASWCFICSIGGSLICCDLCPSSFHIDCLKIKPPTGSFICEDCETGRYPLYNEVLWVKLGTYRWWPSLSLFPSEVPENVKSRPHQMGEFAVRFLGTNDHYWIERGRCFVYHEGDCVDKKTNSKSLTEASYQRGVKEANELHKAHKELRSKIQSQSKPGSMKPPAYTKIKSNKPVGSIKLLEVDTSNISPCECDPNSGHPCSPDSECLNRILMVECDPNTCPAGEKCENQYFEKRIYPSLAPCYTDGRGWGLQTQEDIKKGSFVIEYVGEVIDDEEYQRRLKVKHEDKDENYYFLTIDSTRIIDAGPKGNVSRFMNHSCLPNCETQKWTVAGDTRVGLFALCDVPAGTELTFNYNLESKGNEKKPCMCGTTVCTGFIGAKKNKASQSDLKDLTLGKKKRRRPRVRNLIEDVCLICDGDKEEGALMSCINKECASKYHLACLGLPSVPKGKWLCPRHRCNICKERTHQWCSYCTESFCPTHYDGNLVSDPLHGNICDAHQKNPLSKDHQKKKRDEVIKKREEEKIKIAEAERARRRSRREELFKNEEDSVKVNQSNSELDDAGSDSSTSCEDKPIKPNTLKDEGKKPKARGRPKKTVHEWGSTDAIESSSGVKSRKSLSLHSKRGRKRKDINRETYSPYQAAKSKLGGLVVRRIATDCTEANLTGSSVLDEETPLTSSSINGGKDEIPEADPALDKFIVAPAPIEDEPSPITKKLKLISPKSGKPVHKEASLSSITKRRRKPPMHKDFINSQDLNLKSFRDSSLDKPEKLSPSKKYGPRKHHESNFDGLNHELEDVAADFASDGDQESPKFLPKRPSVRGKVKRLGMGLMRPQVDERNISRMTIAVKVTHPSLDPMKSPTRSTESSPSGSLILGSPKQLSASQMLAAQRAKGLKVMPPNRNLSIAREQALAGRQRIEATEKIERSHKGLKVLKAGKSLTETSTNEKKTENLRNEVFQSSVFKKQRPVLSKVQENGVSPEEDADDKIMDNSVLPLPKLSQPVSIQSPQSRKVVPSSQKQSPAIGNELWNQDILSILSK